MKRNLLPALAATATTAALLTPLSSPASAPEEALQTKRPNIVFVLIDDMGYADLSCYGNKLAQTPHLDQLAAEGIRFTQFTVASPLCSPSRTALTTGQCPARWGITSYLASRAENEKRGMKQWLDPHAPTLARTLQAAGYATGHFGKWHMGGQRDVGDAPLINEYGFDETLTTFEGLGDRVLPLLDDRDGQPVRKMPLGVGSEKLGRGKITWLDRAKVTTAFVDRAITFMRDARKAGKPFYVNIWPDDVHSPFFPSVRDKGDNKKTLYNRVVRETDEQLAPLLDFIRSEPDLRDNTLVVVMSDNGPEPGAGSAGSFRGHKGNLYEGGIREPLIAWGPGWVKTHAVNETTVINGVDMLPSLLSVAGVTSAPAAAKSDGEDLSAALLGRSQPIRTKPLFWIRPPDRPGPEPDPTIRWPDLAVREGDWKLMCREDGSHPELYDLKAHPGENAKVNAAADHPDIVERLTKRVLAWRKTLPVSPLPQAPLPGAVPAGKTSD